jgi:hypothetical protein
MGGGRVLPRMPESLEQLDLLLIEEVRSRRIRRDGIHFHDFRYLSLTLRAYIGENVTIRYDPRDMAEIRVFHQGRFLCRAISAELGGKTFPCGTSFASATGVAKSFGEWLTGIAVRPIEREAHAVLEEIRSGDEARRREIVEKPGCSPCDRPAVDPVYFQTFQFYQARKKEVSARPLSLWSMKPTGYR